MTDTTNPSQDPALAAPRPSRWIWLGVSAFVLGLAAVGYVYTGAPQVVGKTSAEVVAAQGGPGAAAAGAEQAPTREQVQAMVAKLAERMQSRPDDAEGWLMLGRAQMMLGQLPEALVAYERLVQLRPADANILVDYADALAVKNGRTLQGEPLKLIERALKLDPGNLKALALAGSAAFDAQDDVKAVLYWDRAVSIGPPDHEIVQMARDGAAAARERGRLPAQQAPALASAPVATAASAVSGTVRLSAQLKALASPEDMVFIFARPADGSRMPLAIVRKQVKDLPVAFTLDDSSSMSPAARLSGARQVVVGARVSKSGQAMPQPGDLQGQSAPVQVGATGVVVEISSRVP